jgi:hypothetical protein
VDEDQADDDGPGIRLFPLVSWEVANLSDEGVLMRIDYLPGTPTRPVTPEHARALAESISIGMTATECEDLGTALLRAAKEAREGDADETKK